MFLFSFSLLSMCMLASIESHHTVHAQQEIPSYAKWGSLAVQKTKEKYPRAYLIDYLHIGRENGSKVSTEKFKLWLKQDGREFGVLIDIQYETPTEKLVNITFRETDR